MSRNDLARGTTSGIITGFSEDLDMGYEKQFKNNGKTVFGKGMRKSWAVDERKLGMPGPGNYRMQTDFGMYCSTDVKGWAQQDLFLKSRQKTALKSAQLSKRTMMTEQRCGTS